MGESVVEATIARWLKKEGDSVSAGEAVVELETDKVNVEVPAETAGILQSIAEPEGATVNVGALLATVGDSAAVAAPHRLRSPQPLKPPRLLRPPHRPPMGALHQAAPGSPRPLLPRASPKTTSWTCKRWSAAAPAGV